MARSATDILERVNTWPPGPRGITERAREIEARRTGVYQPTPDEEDAIREGPAQLERGEWKS